MKKPSKAAMLRRLLLKNRPEFVDRLINFADFQRERLRRKSAIVPLSQPDFYRKLGETFKTDVDRILQESRLREIEHAVEHGRQRLTANAAFGIFHAADPSMARLCYALCRVQKPRTVIETGVAHGVTTAFLLQALAENGQGELWSIDLPPLAEGADDQVGFLVPTELRSRWHLLRGRTHRVLPELVNSLSSVDMFLHDSLHTFRNVLMELQTVWPKLPGGGLILSDDVDMNRAFETFGRRPGVAASFATFQGNGSSVMGVVLKSRDAGSAT
jgi:predicted O-methyltransferase YrrM